LLRVFVRVLKTFAVHYGLLLVSTSSLSQGRRAPTRRKSLPAAGRLVHFCQKFSYARSQIPQQNLKDYIRSKISQIHFEPIPMRVWNLVHRFCG